jgi:hypothetical protein
MFVTYQHCQANTEGDPAEYVTAWDYLEELTEIDYLVLTCNESLWIVPNTGEPL